MHVWIRLPNLCFSPLRYATTHLPGKYTATAIIEAYHLDAISHHSAPNWTVCLLHFHFPVSALSASLWDRPEKWHSLRLIEHPQAQTKLRAAHRSHAWLPWLIASTLSACEGTQADKGRDRKREGWDWLRENLSRLLTKTSCYMKFWWNMWLKIKKAQII